MIGPAPTVAPSVVELATAHRSGRTSVVGTARATLDRIAAVEPRLHCFAHVDPDAVLARAEALDAVPPAARGPLHGVPVGIKDVIDTVDAPTSYGSPIHAGHRPDRDAVAVARLRAAGALLVGKTVTTEFALATPGPTRNPHDPDRTPGGSSSGSAAAVAAGLLPLALATQTAGSTVRPAAFCGVVGVKPTFGRVPFDGVRRSAEHLDTLGVIARDVAGARLALAVMAGEAVAVPGAPGTGPLRLGWWPGADPAGLAAMDRDARAVLEAAVAALRGRDDVELVAVELPGWFGDLVAAQRALMRHEVWHALTVERTSHPGLLSGRLREYLAAGPDPGGADAALALARRGRRALAAAAGGLDAVLTPAVVGEAPDRSSTGDALLCRTWTLLGGPAVAVPGLHGPAGLPLGVQLVGTTGTDAAVLGAAERLAPMLAGIDRDVSGVERSDGADRTGR